MPWWCWWRRESRWTRADTGLVQDFIALQASSLPKEKASFAQPRPLVSPQRGCCRHQAEPAGSSLWGSAAIRCPISLPRLVSDPWTVPRLVPKAHTQGRPGACLLGRRGPPLLSPKGNLPSPPGSPPSSSPTTPFPTEAMGTATRRPGSKVLPPILPPPCCCLSLQGLPSPSHLHHRPLPPDSTTGGCAPCLQSPD